MNIPRLLRGFAAFAALWLFVLPLARAECEKSLRPEESFACSPEEILRESFRLARGRLVRSVQSERATAKSVCRAGRATLAAAARSFASHGVSTKPLLLDGRPLLELEAGVSGGLPRLAAGLQRRFGYRLVYDPIANVVERTLAYAERRRRLIAIGDKVVEEGAVDVSTLHELRHVLLSQLADDVSRRRDGRELLLGSEVYPGSSFPVFAYRHSFRLDELMSHLNDLVFSSRDLLHGRVKDAAPLDEAVPERARRALKVLGWLNQPYLDAVAAPARQARAFRAENFRPQVAGLTRKLVLTQAAGRPWRAELSLNGRNQLTFSLSNASEGTAPRLTMRIFDAEVTNALREAWEFGITTPAGRRFAEPAVAKARRLLLAHAALATEVARGIAGANTAYQADERERFAITLRQLRGTLLAAYYPQRLE